jgi:transposase-like protein
MSPHKKKDVPKAKGKPQEEISADRKLQIVLDYVRNPKQKKRLCPENGIAEALLDKWHAQFLQRALGIFGDRQAPSPVPTFTASQHAIPPAQRMIVPLPGSTQPPDLPESVTPRPAHPESIAAKLEGS